MCPVLREDFQALQQLRRLLCLRHNENPNPRKNIQSLRRPPRRCEITTKYQIEAQLAKKKGGEI